MIFISGNLIKIYFPKVRRLHLPYVSSFFFVDAKDSYKVYYISPKGFNNETCGETAQTTCETLEYVLSLYYNGTHPPDLGLEIIASKSLIIDKTIMVSEHYKKYFKKFIITFLAK